MCAQLCLPFWPHSRLKKNHKYFPPHPGSVRHPCPYHFHAPHLPHHPYQYQDPLLRLHLQPVTVNIFA
ncbi:hypothetical protein P154DRAFT_32481 [Amniculicola lignicola CBS 123094]|uniref:Uncharacterized protein n=1 Tax=Amniculicola lignicola CBS 123094 TaxID=1392246 RepID=A0A6A5VXX2_9PLEO|nr:hypothetical protein P154DRAFT_32481 [Amniculicola lignicola CBS 123094]